MAERRRNLIKSSGMSHANEQKRDTAEEEKDDEEKIDVGERRMGT